MCGITDKKKNMKRTTSVSKQLTTGRAVRRVGAPSGPRNADLRRANLIDTASKLFMEKGYEATTMDEIAAGAGVAKGTLYHYFASKSELLEVLKDGFEDEVMNRVRSRVERCAADNWCGRLKAWIEGAANAYFDMSKLHDVIFFGAGMPLRSAMAEAEITRYLAKLISDGAKAGVWQVDDEVWTALIMFYGFRGGCDEAIIGTQCAEDISSKLYYLFLRILGVHE
ncbi:MAG: TetR/AcrR family transcriptional regulator [Thermodesulfobacteriota bacterium]|jgi:AcrR family transcriptional regulator|nr:TetR/AcrR family transcriptional regulator [Thermodesulfobacteriota bacterium]